MGFASLSLAALTTLVLTVGTPLRFEAEDVTVTEDAWAENQFSQTKWNLWSTDRDAEKKWSEGIVLQSPRVLADRQQPADGAPPLHSIVTTIPPGEYHVEIGGVGRPLGISLDGTTWRKIDGSNRILGPLKIENRFEIWLDDRYASRTNPGSCYFDYLEFTPLPDPNRKSKIHGFAETRIDEPLDRGIVALPRRAGEIYIGWRLLKTDQRNSAFDVYRRTPRHPTTKLNETPIRQTTDFADKHPLPGVDHEYFVVPAGDRPAPDAQGVRVRPADQPVNHLSIRLDGDHTFQKCGIADLDGDGNYDYVIKQPNASIDPYEKYWKPSPETYKIEAYLSDGTFLWRHDLGWAIERGIWYSPMVVYDLDGDGKAEVCLKSGQGDRRDADGRVRSGPEYVLVLDGLTGKEKARAEWPARDLFPAYNYASRNQMCVAYLDGKTPCLILQRGTYNVIHVRAYQLHAGKLQQLWQWDDGEEGPRYRGQGAHSMHAVDIDDDGRDEVFLGSAVLDDHGVGLWSTGLGHPDHHYVGDIDPNRPGLEVYYGMETRQTENGCCLVDAGTGEILWGLGVPSRHVHSTGMCADIDASVPGLECYSSDTDQLKESNIRWLFSGDGKILRNDLDWGFGLRNVYWDADTQKELVRGRRIFQYNGQDYGAVLAGSIVAIADVLGDWREELVMTLPGELRIYTTTIPANDRRICLMQDPLYRADVCIQAMGYTQCPMTTRCLSCD